MNWVSCFITQYTDCPYKYLSDPVWKKCTSEMWGFCLPCSSPRKCDLQQEQHCYTFKAGSPCSQQLVMVKYECCLHILYGSSEQAAAPAHVAGTVSMRAGGKQCRIAVSVLGLDRHSQRLLCSLPPSLRVAWSFRRETLGLLWLQR